MRQVNLLALLILTVLLHVCSVIWFTTPPHDTDEVRVGAQPIAEVLAPLPGSEPPAQGRLLLIVTATQPTPCTTLHGDYIVQLALKNKLQYATINGYSLWASTELLSPWDLGGQWNKVALLSVLAEPDSPAAAGAGWLLWVDDDAIFCDVNFRFPFEKYDLDGTNLVMWGDEKMTYEAGNSEGINTGTMLLRRCDWSRRLLEAWAALASSPVRETLVNHDQGGLVYLLYNQPDKWR